MKLKVAVCEDDKFICEDTIQRITRLRSDYLIDTYENGESLLSEKISYDMIFLDIEMPGKDGMCIAKELRERQYKGHIVFLTSHTEFMPEAFKVKAFRFLQKPIKDNELDETLVEAEKEILTDKKIIVTDYGMEFLINISDIRYIEARKNKTIIYTMDHELETNYTLKYWMQELGTADFFQVHKSYIVSLRYIKMFDEGYVVLHGMNEMVPVSRRNTSLLKKSFFEYIKVNAKYI